MMPSTRPSIIIFTDLDGTLLDHDTYRWDEAAPALDTCRSQGIPVILVTSKTKAELTHLQESLGLAYPFISENGGGIYFQKNSFARPPRDMSLEGGFLKCSLGIPYADIRKGLKEIRKATGWNIRGFSDMTLKEISRITGLAPEAAKLASIREYDEPFMILEEQRIDEAALREAAAKRGLTVSKGGRFYHLQGNHDKGRAMEKVLSWYKSPANPVCSIALGDSENDFSMLDRADYPVLVRSKKAFPEIKKRIPRLRVTREPGPRGWNTAVLDILRKKLEEADG